MKNYHHSFLIALFFGILSPSVYAISDCTKDGAGNITDTNTCYVQPDEYYMTVYKIGICTSQPVAPSSNTPADLSSCTTVFENANGSRIKILKGVSSSLTGTITRPANAAYNYGYVLAAPQMEIKHLANFSPARISDSSGYPSGSKCWSTLGKVYAWDGTLGNPLATFYPAKCGTTPSDNDVSTNIINTFKTSNDGALSIFSSGTANAYLVKNDLSLGTGVANSLNDISRLLGVSPMSATVSSTTTGLDIGFQVSQGSTVIQYSNAQQSISGAIVYFAGGPFGVNLTLK